MAPPAPKRVIYLDTCVIIEAHRTRCWKALAARHDLHTVDECIAELRTGNPRDREYVAVNCDAIARDVTIHIPTTAQKAALRLRSAKAGGLDAGERDLLAFFIAQDDRALLLTTGDRAAILAACELDLVKRLISLEELAREAGARPDLQHHFCKEWLSGIRTAFYLGEI